MDAPELEILVPDTPERSTTEDFWAHRPGEFPLLCRFDLRHDRDGAGAEWLTLNLELRPGEPSDMRYLLLTFTDVHGLRFIPEGLFPIPLYLEILDIRDRHWDGVSYQVFNQEQDVELSFYAREFEFRSGSGWEDT
jgi:hypothetical protein